jgi:hypothetical protein
MTTSCVLPLLILLHLPLAAQILPDRIVVLDPLGRHEEDSAGFSWLNGSHLYAEFGRYSNGSGGDHRWNAKTGGYIEFARWDSTASIAMVGTAEIVVDPMSDIGFNPRAIFWEEGVLASLRLAHEASLQLGYVHRCKHDIDNYDVSEERTLIYSGITTRALWRPGLMLDGPFTLTGGLALRNDFFLHLLDYRSGIGAQNAGGSIESLVDAVNLCGRVDLRPREARYGIHFSADFMLSLVGAERGFSERFHGIRALGSFPYAELGIDLFNPHGAALTIFARGEWQRDAGIHATPERATLALFGVRVGTAEGMW